MMKFKTRDQIPFLEGLLLGVSLSLIAGLFLVVKNNQRPKVVPLPTFTVSPTFGKTASSTITVTPIPRSTLTEPASGFSTPTSEPTVEEILRRARSSLDEGSPEKTKELLLPAVEKWSLASDKAAGYKLLGDAEMSLRHPQLAAPYYEKVYFYDPTPENLYTLALTYDMGGDLCKAFLHYKELDAWSDPNARIDREFIKSRISRIEDIGCTPVTPAKP